MYVETTIPDKPKYNLKALPNTSKLAEYCDPVWTVFISRLLHGYALDEKAGIAFLVSIMDDLMWRFIGVLGAPQTRALLEWYIRDRNVHLYWLLSFAEQTANLNEQTSSHELAKLALSLPDKDTIYEQLDRM